MRIGIVAPSSRFGPEARDAVLAIAAERCPGLDLVFHPQCFEVHNHFAGTDESRLRAFVEFANDPAIDAIWFARGGYGACRIASAAISELGPAANAKTYMGYSDAGFLLAALYRAGIGKAVHGPMVQDALRPGGEAAIHRTLAFLERSDPDALEPGLEPGSPYVAFNLAVLSSLMGTDLEPDLRGHILLLEEVSEAHYRIDRAFFHLTSQPAIRGVAGIRLGSCRDIVPNEPDFGESEEEIARFWCDRAGIRWLGRARIGHDADNRIVPFGRF